MQWSIHAVFLQRLFIPLMCLVFGIITMIKSQAPNFCFLLNVSALASFRLRDRLVWVRAEATQAPLWPGGNIDGEETELWHSEEELWLSLGEGCSPSAFFSNKHAPLPPLLLFLTLWCAHFDGPSGKVVKEQSQSSRRWPGATLQGGSAENEQLGYNDSSASQPGKKKELCSKHYEIIK